MEREIKDVAGTPNWMAPEVIELKGASTKSDIWSLGCTVIELLTGRPPYAEIANSMSGTVSCIRVLLMSVLTIPIVVMFRIVEDEMPPVPDSCSELLQDFLKQCFQKDPGARPSAEMLCEHAWLKSSWQELKVWQSCLVPRYMLTVTTIGSQTSGQHTIPSPCQHRLAAEARCCPLSIPDGHVRFPCLRNLRSWRRRKDHPYGSSYLNVVCQAHS